VISVAHLRSGDRKATEGTEFTERILVQMASPLLFSSSVSSVISVAHLKQGDRKATKGTEFTERFLVQMASPLLFFSSVSSVISVAHLKSGDRKATEGTEFTERLAHQFEIRLTPSPSLNKTTPVKRRLRRGGCFTDGTFH